MLPKITSKWEIFVTTAEAFVILCLLPHRRL
jgi:hypothetical protein